MLSHCWYVDGRVKPDYRKPNQDAVKPLQKDYIEAHTSVTRKK
jgi:hypothetical protein